MSSLNLRTCTLLHQHVAHEHDHHQLILATSGITELSIEGQGGRITREQGCLIPMGHHHCYEGDGCNRTLVLDAPMAAVDASPCGEEVKRLFSRRAFFTVTPPLQQLISALIQQVDHYPLLREDVAALVVRSLYHTLHDRPAERQGYRHRPSPQRRLDLSAINHYIDRHLAEPLTIDGLARVCALSPSHFHACFRAATGMTPMAYLQQRRLAHARFLIEDTDLPLGHIAGLVGYRDQASFTRAYRRGYGAPPSSHRGNLA